MAACLFKSIPAGLAVSLRVTPNAARERIDGVAADADGNQYLKVTVTAAPENGRANAAVIKLIAKDLHLPKSSLSIASGAAARRKTLLIAGDTNDLAIRLDAITIEWAKPRDAA